MSFLSTFKTSQQQQDAVDAANAASSAKKLKVSGPCAPTKSPSAFHKAVHEADLMPADMHVEFIDALFVSVKDLEPESESTAKSCDAISGAYWRVVAADPAAFPSGVFKREYADNQPTVFMYREHKEPHDWYISEDVLNDKNSVHHAWAPASAGKHVPLSSFHVPYWEKKIKGRVEAKSLHSVWADKFEEKLDKDSKLVLSESGGTTRHNTSSSTTAA